MKSLYESLLDDFEEIADRQDKSNRDEIFEGSKWRVGSDNKTIIFNPPTTDHFENNPPILCLGEKTLGDNLNINALAKAKAMGLKFQPLVSVHDNIKISTQEILDNLECESMAAFYTELGNKDSKLDFSKVKFNTHYIDIKPLYGRLFTLDEIKPYSKQLETAKFYVLPKGKPLYGWKCKNMLIHLEAINGDCLSNSNIYTENFENHINQILQDNPEAETIYLCDPKWNYYCKVATKGKGPKRHIVKVSKISRDKWESMSYPVNLVPAWKAMRTAEDFCLTHRELFECDCVTATPGNTLGMGNPMVPTATEPGTEPVIPTHPKRKKKTDKKNRK